MRITVIGTGYVGLVTGACLADVGNHVTCLDVDAGKIERLKQGILPIYEPGLDAIVARNYKAGRLMFTTDPVAATHAGEIQMIAVGTPPDEDGSADLQYVVAAARAIGRNMDSSKIVITKSTVPVGTADKVRDAIADELAKRSSTLTFAVGSNPEFLKEGAAVEDFMKPDRIVIGADDPATAARLEELYQPFQRNHNRTMVMSIRSAELTKYAANAMLATRISFMNELARLADVVGADIEMVRKGIGSDPRIGWDFLYSGTGYGGSCFPKDVQALLRTSKQNGQDALILQAVEDVNERQKRVLVDYAHERFGSLKGMTFAVWGLAFKPNTDDMREAPARVIIEQLWAEGAKVQAYDPVASHECERIYGQRDDLRLVDHAYAALEGADALIIVTEWKEFRSPDFAAIKAALKSPVVLDGRNLYEPKSVRAAGLEYFPIGRRAS